MRFTVLCLGVFILFLFTTEAIGQNEGLYDPSVDGTRCSALRMELANTERRLLEINPQYKTGQTLQLMTDTLNGSIAALDNMKGDAAKTTKELKKIMDYMKGQHESLESAVEQAMNASSELSDKTEAVINRLKQANKFLEIALRAERAPTATEMAKAFDDYYQAIKEPLGPYLKAIPLVGGFIDAYGEAIHSAAGSIANIESIRRKQRDLMLEITGKDYYRHLSKEEKEWQQLTNRASAIRAELGRLDCDSELEAPEPEGPDVPQEILDKCQKSAGLADNYNDEMLALFRKIAVTKANLDYLESQFKKLQWHNKSLKSNISSEQARLQKYKEAMTKDHKNVIKLIKAFDRTQSLGPNALPPQFPSNKEQVIYEIQYLPGLKGNRAYQYVLDYLKDTKKYREQNADVERMRKQLPEGEKEQSSLSKSINKARGDLENMRRTEAEYDRKIDAMTDCIEKEMAADKTADKKKLPKCKPFNSILGGLGRVQDEIDGKCSGG